MEDWSTIRDTEMTFDQQYCLQRCGVCHDDSFVVVDGETVRGQSYQQIIADLSTSEAVTEQ